ncbi:helix-turn-helix transcriptional regulator [Colwellia sp. MB3u-70]|uniref:helix-turn-helix domain-containing protein n=1 Tax=unclassified Colwellia TaxID=196834 RepID=UPI0015F43384|nr:MULTISPECIES: helix-turn-helix transcriptional regulator [unclassified Colwellia]MBA6293197.1 helix-turn-helix transcriptional regulator [Colwellia sp. MB3u-8]MBA6307031.1 helix-turn-helix transcriptional regulator [Colwellia sp. MB3u-70]
MAKRVIATKAPNLDLPVDMKRLGEFVRFKRTSLDITIESAASLCGVSKQSLNNIELGVDSVKLVTLFKVTKQLGISLWFDSQNTEGTKEIDDEWL